MCLPARLVVNEATGTLVSTSVRSAEASIPVGIRCVQATLDDSSNRSRPKASVEARTCGRPAPTIAAAAPTVRCTSLRAEDGPPITTTRAEPNPWLGASGAHRRVDRPPARGDRPADPGVQARAGPRARRRPGHRRPGVDFDDEIDLRAEDDALIAAELEAAEAAARGGGRGGRGRGRGGRERRRPSAGAAGGAAVAAPGARARRSRRPSTTARRATACGSIRPSRTIRSTPSTGPVTGRSRSRSRRIRS